MKCGTFESEKLCVFSTQSKSTLEKEVLRKLAIELMPARIELIRAD